LAGLLRAYLKGNADSADKSRRYLQAFFAKQLASAGNEGFLLYNEEEDILNVFSKWTRQNLRKIPCEIRKEKFVDLEERFERIASFPGAALIKGIQ
jgi:hypothetical protein